MTSITNTLKHACKAERRDCRVRFHRLSDCPQGTSTTAVARLVGRAAERRRGTTNLTPFYRTALYAMKRNQLICASFQYPKFRWLSYRAARRSLCCGTGERPPKCCCLTSRCTRSFFRPERLLSARALCVRLELVPPADGGIMHPQRRCLLSPRLCSGVPITPGRAGEGAS